MESDTSVSVLSALSVIAPQLPLTFRDPLLQLLTHPLHSIRSASLDVLAATVAIAGHKGLLSRPELEIVARNFLSDPDVHVRLVCHELFITHFVLLSLPLRSSFPTFGALT